MFKIWRKTNFNFKYLISIIKIIKDHVHNNLTIHFASIYAQIKRYNWVTTAIAEIGKNLQANPFPCSMRQTQFRFAGNSKYFEYFMRCHRFKLWHIDTVDIVTYTRRQFEIFPVTNLESRSKLNIDFIWAPSNVLNNWKHSSCCEKLAKVGNDSLYEGGVHEYRAPAGVHTWWLSFMNILRLQLNNTWFRKFLQIAFHSDFADSKSCETLKDFSIERGFLHDEVYAR